MATIEVEHDNVRTLQSAAVPGERELWNQLRAPETPEQFLEAWLELQCQMLEGVTSGLIFTRNEVSGVFEPAATWPRGRRAAEHLMKVAEKALAERRALALQLDPQGEAAGKAGVRTVVAQIVEVSGQLEGSIVLDVLPRPPEDLERLLRRLAWGIPWLERSFQRGSASGGHAAQLDALLDIIAGPLEHDRFQAAAAAFATELATRLDCDRVSLGFAHRGLVRLRAVSHSAQFSQRANLVRALEAAMEESLDQESSVVWPAEFGALPQVTRCHELLAGESGAGAIFSIPVVHGSRFCGVVLLERGANAPFVQSEQQLAETVVDLVGPMLDIQYRDDRWIGAKVLDSMHETATQLVGPGHIGLKLGVAVVGALILLLSVVKGDYRIVADTSVEARVLRAAVAPFDGYIAEAPARPGDRVRKGDLLARLDDRDLVLQRARWSSEVAQLTKEVRQAMAERDAAKIRIISAQLEQARAQDDLARSQLEKTQLLAPFDGIVVTGDLSQKLESPVQRGELLFEVAPLDEFRLALKVDESEIDDMVVGQRGELVFSAFPAQVLGVTVSKITPVSEASEGQNTFRVEARLDETPPRVQPGMEGVAKIEVDQRRLIWIWTHDIVDWLRLTFWRWTP